MVEQNKPGKTEVSDYISTINSFIKKVKSQFPGEYELPDNIELSELSHDSGALSQARDLAARQKNWQVVIASAEIMKKMGNKSEDLYSLQFDALINTNDIAGAKYLLFEALAQFPDSFGLLVKQARFLTLQRNYRSAAKKWVQLQNKNPKVQELYIMGAFALEQSDQTDKASKFLIAGMRELPDSIDIWLAYVTLAIRRNSLEEAREQWTLLYPKFISDYRSSLLGATLNFLDENYQRADLLLERSLIFSNSGETSDIVSVRSSIERLKFKKIIMNFESLSGGFEGCEFGLVQRAYGAEPLGLLRWAAMKVDALIDCLENRFSGIGDPENTILLPPHKDGDDWMTSDVRFGMRMHTFRRESLNQEDREKFYTQACRRLQFLKRKLISDLESGEKIFVYKTSYENIDIDRLNRLCGAIQRFGDAMLLYVRQPDRQHPAGMVERVHGQLMIGYIERFSFEFGPEGRYIGPSTECWVPIVRRAYEIWQANLGN